MTIAIAYKTVADGTGLPLLEPMSKVTGWLAAQAAAMEMMRHDSRPGLRLGGAPAAQHRGSKTLMAARIEWEAPPNCTC